MKMKNGVESPPDWGKVLAPDPSKYFGLLADPEVARFVHHANDHYLAWQELKHRPLPKGLSQEEAWTVVKLSRMGQLKKIPLVATDGVKFGYSLADGVQRDLHFLNQNTTGQILVNEPVVGLSDNKEKYIINSLMEEAIASSIMEGAATTRKQAKQMLREGRKPASRGEQMISNNYRVMRKVKGLVSKPLTPEMVHAIQSDITLNTLDDPTASGRFRRSDEEVRVIDMSSGELLHDPPPAAELPSRLESMCRFANRSSEEIFMPPLVTAVILHFWLAYDHPYVDGNGRTARALFYWYLLKNNYWLLEYLPISRIFLRAPARYKRSFLFSETDDHDITYFISFNLRALRLAVQDLKSYLVRKQEEVSHATELLRHHQDLNHRQREILTHAIKHPEASYTIARHKITHGIVYQTARTDLLGLAQKGYLDIERVGQTMRFLPRKDLARRLKSRRTKRDT